MVFAADSFRKTCQEQNVDMYTTFVDLTASREGLWKIMEKISWPPRLILIIRQFHDGMLSQVLDDGETSEPFLVANGVNQ
jgi:hypothetical protein